MRYNHDSLLPEQAFRPVGFGGSRRMTLEGKGGGSPPPPNYAPMQQASEYAARLGKELGDAQLAEAQRQYDLNREIATPVVQAQLDMMRQTQRQGEDYYNYSLRGRPVEDSLNAESMNADLAGQEAARRGIMDLANQNYADNNRERGLVTGGDTDIYNARQGDIEQSAGRAAADARQGQSAMLNQLIRQGQRYGYSGAAMAQRFAPQAMNAGLGVASSMNQARQQGIDRSRGLLAQSYDMRNANVQQQLGALNADRAMGIQDKAQNWARKMDVAGLYRGMPGASQGAYGLAMGAGNAAVANQMQPGNALMTGRAQGAGMQQTGAGQQITGLGNILQSQTSIYNAGQQAAGQGSGLMGGILGLAGSIIPMFPSDERLKTDIRQIGTVKEGINWYSFRWKATGALDQGVLAQEVEKVMPEAVTVGDDGYKRVNYTAVLGCPIEEV